MKSAFETFWATVEGRFPSETSRYFAKPLLREAFAAGQKAKADKITDAILTSEPVATVRAAVEKRLGG